MRHAIEFRVPTNKTLNAFAAELAAILSATGRRQSSAVPAVWMVFGSVCSRRRVRRPILLAEMYNRLLAVAPRVAALCPLILIVVHDTGHRIGAVLQLRWSDLDLDAPTPKVRWRAEADKLGSEHKTPLSEECAALLRRAWRDRASLGDGWVFSSAVDESRPLSRHRARVWWDRLSLAGLPTEAGRGWHSMRRQFATELKTIALVDLAALGGWKSAQTILKCYQKPDELTLRSALALRGSLRAAGLVGAQRTPSTDTNAPIVGEKKNPASA
jgi:integrase